MRKYIPVLLALVALSSAFAAVHLPKPARTPANPTDAQVALIREGVAMHDLQNYEGAIAKYKKVLAENPWEVNALHELALSYFAAKNYKEALETARRGAQCQSRELAAFYVMIGNCLDELGKNKDALDTYKSAVKLSPDEPYLHYNYAISLRRSSRLPEAKTEAEASAQLSPAHASSHAVLGYIYQDMGYRVPAIMALSRFLVLEPETSRADEIRQRLTTLLAEGVGKGKNGSDITIFMNVAPKGRQDEGDFSSVELALSMVRALDFMKTDDDKKLPVKSPYEKMAHRYLILGETLTNAKPKDGFAASFYAPYFAALAKDGHVDAFTAYTWRAAKVEGLADWADANQSKLGAFLAWSKSYRWPAK